MAKIQPKPTVVVIIQARMGSSRLPGKVLKTCFGKIVLGWVVDRLSKSVFEPQIIVATTDKEEDDLISRWCETQQLVCFRGSEWDVLGRFYNAYKKYSDAKVIVRICADNPLISFQVMDRVITEYCSRDCDYMSNANHPPNYSEDGFAVEVFSPYALELAHMNAKLLSEREHVCPWMKKELKANWINTCPGYSHKLSVDTQQDLRAVERVFQELEAISDFSIEEVDELLNTMPEIKLINHDSIINSGYHKSINNDRLIK